MSTIYPQPGGQIPTYTGYATLPAIASNGALAITTDTYTQYVFRSTPGFWEQVNYTVPNLLINGNMDFFQRTASRTHTSSTSANNLVADRWRYIYLGATAFTFTVASSASIPAASASGWQGLNALSITATSAVSSYASGEFFEPIIYRLEGEDYQAIHNRRACLSFWFVSTVTGTYSVSFSNADRSRSYVTTFTVGVANSYTHVVIPLAMDSTGTWNNGTGTGLEIMIAPVTGSTYQTSTLGSWQAGDFRSANTTTNWTATAGAIILITQVMLTVGVFFSAFTRRAASFAQELRACQRYYEKTYAVATAAGTNTSTGAYVSRNLAGATANGSIWLIGQHPTFVAAKRVAPTISIWTSAGTSNTWTVGAVDRTSSTTNISTAGFQITNNTGGSISPGTGACSGQWAADAEL